MTSSLKKAKLDILIDIDVMKERGIIEHVMLFINMKNLIKKYIKDYDKHKESCYLKYQDIKNLCG